MKKLLAVFLVCASCSCKKKDEIALTQPVREKYIPVTATLDAYTSVQYGNMPLVISVPHGGTLQPPGIPDRTCPGITTVTDNNTIAILLAIDSIAFADYNIKPSWVYTNLSRLKIDENRALPEATCSNPAVYQYWNNYHNGLDTCIGRLLTRYPQCIFIDLHGHGHTIQRCELGYLLTATELQNPSTLTYSGSSLSHGVGIFGGKTIQQMLSGSAAFGSYLFTNGFAAVPAATDPAPAVGDPYFDGGYNTAWYTGNGYPKVFGWQIETNYTGLRDNYTDRVAFAKAFMRSIIAYFNNNTNMPSAGFGY